MAQHYTDPSREENPHALPDVETFQAHPIECRHCGAGACLYPEDAREGVIVCSECGKRTHTSTKGSLSWYYWFCFPGCVPNGDPVGPFASEAEALADAREGMEME